MSDKLKNDLAKTLDKELVAYSTLWEDHKTLEDALDIKPNDNIISITSAGCNVLSLLLKEPRSITAIDLNPSQNFFFRLKVAGIKYLEHQDFLKLFGYTPSKVAWDIFLELEHCIDSEVADYFLQRKDLFSQGLCHCGKLEKYFQGFSNLNLNEKTNLTDLNQILLASSLEEQSSLFSSFFTPEFESLFLDYFSKNNQAKEGRDKEKYNHVTEDNIAKNLLQRFKKSVKNKLLKDNFYIQYLLTGSYLGLENAYPYLQKKNFDKLKTLISRVKIVTDELESHIYSCDENFYSKANLSDIFEYMPKDKADTLLQQIANRMQKNGRIAYWNLYVDRNSHDVSNLKRLNELSSKLKEDDRVWFYKNFNVDEVL